MRHSFKNKVMWVQERGVRTLLTLLLLVHALAFDIRGADCDFIRFDWFFPKEIRTGSPGSADSSFNLRIAHLDGAITDAFDLILAQDDGKLLVRFHTARPFEVLEGR